MTFSHLLHLSMLSWHVSRSIQFRSIRIDVSSIDIYKFNELEDHLMYIYLNIDFSFVFDPLKEIYIL